MCLDGFPLAGLHESSIDLPHVGPGTHEGKSIFGVTVEFTRPPLQRILSCITLRLLLRKRKAYLNMFVLMWGAWRTFDYSVLWLWDSRVLSGAADFK